MRSTVIRIVTVGVTLAAVVGVARAQIGAGQITGLVTAVDGARVPVGGGVEVELRLEVFNLLNTTQFSNPNGVFGNANFGTITSALDPRVAQLAVKVLF